MVSFARNVRGLAVACGAFGSVVVTGPASAQSYVLTYESPQGCPSEAAFRSDVRAHVHDASRAAGARIAVEISRGEAGFHGELSAIDQSGQKGRRTIEGSTCAEVAHALAFLAGLAIELGGRLEEPKPEPEPAPPTPPTPEAPPPKPAAPPPAQQASGRGTDFEAVVLGEVRSGLAPELRPALTAAFGILPHRQRNGFSPAARLGVTGAQSELQGDGGSATVRLFSVRAEGCPLLVGGAGAPSVSLRPCLGAEWGHMWAESHADERPVDGDSAWAAADAVLRLTFRLSSAIFAETNFAASVSLIRPQFYFEPDRLLYTVPPFTGRAAVGVGALF